MSYFPFYVDIKDKKCLIVGGGMVALRKAMALLEFEADIIMVAPYICKEAYSLVGKIQYRNRPYEKKDLDEVYFVIAATDDPVINKEIANTCKERNVLVNVVDVKEDCNFIFPAYIKMGDISVGISTGGNSPIMAGMIKNQIKEVIPEYYEDLIAVLGSFRDEIKEKVPDSRKRSCVFQELVELGIKQKGQLSKLDLYQTIDKVIN